MTDVLLAAIILLLVIVVPNGLQLIQCDRRIKELNLDMARITESFNKLTAAVTQAEADIKAHLDPTEVNLVADGLDALTTRVTAISTELNPPAPVLPETVPA